MLLAGADGEKPFFPLSWHAGLTKVFDLGKWKRICQILGRKNVCHFKDVLMRSFSFAGSFSHFFWWRFHGVGGRCGLLTD